MKKRRQPRATSTFVLLAGLVLSSGLVWAQDSEDTGDAQDADALARKLSNPAAANWSIGNNFDFIKHAGSLPDAGGQTSILYLLQAAMPKKLSSGNILFRPGVPILISQTIPGADGFQTVSGLGDIGFDLAYGSTNPNTGLLYFVGIVGTVPTNTIESTPNLWSFGPEFAIGLFKKWGVVGVLASQQWDLSGGPAERSVGGGQYFYAFSLGGGWQFAGGPTFSYNWIGRDLTLPIAGGLAKTLILGSMPLKIFGQVWYYVAKPETFGQDWSVRLTISPVVKALW